MGLLLRAVEVENQYRWRWLLVDEATGTPLADHQVALDQGSWEATAFGDLYRQLWWQAEPDRRVESEARLVTRLGDWIGQRVLGQAIGRQIAAAAPVTVRVEVPPGAEFLLFRPLELAHVDGVPLARRGDVGLVFDVGTRDGDKQPVAGRLRMLAVFSLPSESTALALRRERYELTRLIRRLAAREGRAVDLEVLQYGVTTERLAERMTVGGGTDLLHISGHGGAGEVVLETADGSADPVSTADLLKLLSPARRRVKLAVFSACQSAAATVAETLGWLGQEEAAAQAQAEAEAEVAPDEATAPVLAGVARQIAVGLDCAVIAMRYPVYDEFAIALADELYEGLFHLDLPADEALSRAVKAAAGDTPSPSRPALSIATPTLFGGRAVGLSLTPPTGQPQMDPAAVKMAYFLTEPERFVGRARAMAQASTALAPGSAHAAVLFHGMAGAGKTACALELAYRHQDAFATLAFWQAPTNEDEFAGALTGLALALEKQLGDYGFAMVDKIGTVEQLRTFLPRLSRLLADEGVLLVLDNLETLLTPAGTWRDPRWAELVNALTSHHGFSRTILTSRIRPEQLDGRVLVEPVHALSRDETVLLSRELPNLRGLLHTDPGPVRHSAANINADRATLTQVLHLVQGHPKLLELADAAAVDQQRLATHLAAAQETAATQGGALQAFFEQGQSRLDDTGFLDVLSVWTTATVATLPDDARLLLQMLCQVEDDDRHSEVVDGNWADLWHRLDRSGDPPSPTDALPPLIAAALVHSEPMPSGEEGPRLALYRIHPGVAEAVRATMPADLRAAVDLELAAWWTTIAVRTIDREGGEHTPTVVYAALAAIPYLLRQHDWGTAATLLERVIERDGTPTTALTALPYLRRIADTTGTIEDAGTFAKVLARVDPGGAEPLMRQLIGRAVTAKRFGAASTISAYLAYLLMATGRPREALVVADRKAEQTRQAGLGPWTQLADHGLRLQVLRLLGQPDQVLTELEPLHAQMRNLSDQPANNDPIPPWNVWETTVNLGVLAAGDLGRWEQALDLNAEVWASKRRRGAGPHEIAGSRFNDCVPLLRLGRLDEAVALLRSCQQVFEDHDDIEMLGKVLTARADVAYERGHLLEATALEQTALRYKYLRPDMRPLVASHYNLAGYLAGTDPAGQIAHRLASVLLCHVTGMEHGLAMSIRALARDLRTTSGAWLPRSVVELAAKVERVEGVRFTALVNALSPDPNITEAALVHVIQQARDLPDEQALNVPDHVERWEPGITALVTAVGGNAQAATAIDEMLTQAADNQDWAALAAVWRRILAGERAPDVLLAGLDPIGTAITQAALDRLAVTDSPEHDVT